MNSNQKTKYKKMLLPIAFIVLLIITIFFNQKAFSEDKEALGTEVYVKVIDIRTNSNGLNPGGLVVTVSYQGEEYKLNGVPSNAHFVMENSRKYRSEIKAKLYNGKLYYDSTSIHLLADKIYYFFLAATFLVFCIMCTQWLEKQRGNRRMF